MKTIASFARTAALTALFVAFIALVSWAIRSLAPRPGISPAYPAPSEEPVRSAAPAATGTAPEQATPIPRPTATPLPVYNSKSLPGVNLVRLVDFPESPVEAPVYAQNIAAPLTVEKAQEIATRLGVEGPLYSAPGEGGGLVYVAHDGERSVTFVEAASYYFYTGLAALASQPGNLSAYPAPDAEAAISTASQEVLAEAFLKEHGLVDFPHTFEPLDNNLGSLRVVPLLEGLPVRHGPNINLRLNQEGQVVEFGYGWPGAVPVGNYPILTAEEAWQKVLEGAGRGLSVGWRPNEPSTFQTWQRSYPPGQRVEINGYFGRPLQPLEPGVDPLVIFGNLPVRGEKLEAFLQSFQVADFVEISGQVQVDERGRRYIQLESWQLSPYEDVTLSGVIRRQGETSILESEGQRLLLPDIPTEMPDGLQVEARGVIRDGLQPLFDWSFIQAGETGAFGIPWSLAFAELNLEPGSPSTPTPLPEGARPGDKIEGLEASVSIYSDGIGLLTLDESRWFYVQAPAPEGLTALHNLPVRVWGEVSEPINGQPSIRIERYEEVFPGLRVQAWLGTWENARVEGQDVLLFTAQDSTLEDVPPGTKYVIFSPGIETGGPEVHGGVGRPGDIVLYEGLAVPGQQFGGYPVIHVFSGAVANERQSLDGYATPAPMPESSSPDAAPGLPQGQATIDQIELIYYTTDTRGGPRDPSYPVYVQPAWRFVGRYTDGTRLEILVQALREEYLK